MGVRDKAMAHLAQVPPIPAEVRSNVPLTPERNLFWKLCGFTHSQLTADWANKKNTTSCNSFCGGTYAAAIGASPHLGFFGLQEVLKKRNKSYAWIPSTPGARPKYGDVFEIKGRLHQGISLDFEGSVWNTAEGGQGGSKTGYDVIKRKKHPQPSDVMTHFDGFGRPEPLQGWVDIDLYVNGPAAAVLTMPAWLPGWWAVPWRGQMFYYFFEKQNNVSWTFKKPMSDFMVPASFDDTATITFDTAESMTIKWKATGSIEKFRKLGADAQRMEGDWNTSEPLTAKRCFYNPTSI